ncbi:MAG TPA: hypothetical protein DEQ40_19100 [Oxalobacteraceae bacterium]|jgi:hypothetical protein|nr:hypothetical protein [Oxalobacteraceae bacterium]
MKRKPFETALRIARAFRGRRAGRDAITWMLDEYFELPDTFEAAANWRTASAITQALARNMREMQMEVTLVTPEMVAEHPGYKLGDTVRVRIPRPFAPIP